MAARWQRAGRNGHTPRLIVIHCTVSPEMGNGAEAVARYFETTDRPGSTHKVSDNNSTVRCVEDEDTAYGAAGANLDGLHLELVGQPDQSAEEWLDDYSTAELHEAGPTIREWSTRWAIPLRWLSVAEVADGVSRGLCTHADVSAAFPAVSTGHWDPGPNFSKTEALRIWQGEPIAPTPEPSIEPLEGTPMFMCRISDRNSARYGLIAYSAGPGHWRELNPEQAGVAVALWGKSEAISMNDRQYDVAKDLQLGLR